MKQQITKRAITESFRALLAVKPLDKITVRDIVEDCGLTRNTFYYHYEDIYDLLSDVLESEIERALSVPAGGASWETMLLDMLSFLTDSPQIGRHIFQSKCQDAMRVYLSKVISELSDRYIEQNVRDLDYSQQDRKLICDICCHALYGLLEEWLTAAPTSRSRQSFAASPSCSRARCAMRWNSAPLIRAPECHTNIPECMDFAHRSGNE